MSKILIGITGTLAAGKGTVVEYLIKQYGFRHYSVRQFLEEALSKRGTEAKNRDDLRRIADELRECYGGAYVIEQIHERALVNNNGRIIIESIRAEAEIEYLKSEGAFLLAVDADPGIRHKRAMARKSLTDQVSLQEFIAQEQMEMNNPNPAQGNLKLCMERAICTFDNTPEDPRHYLYPQIEKFLKDGLKL